MKKEICHAIHRYPKAGNKYMKDYDKNKVSSHHKYCDVDNLSGLAMLQKLPVNNFEWIEDTSQFNEDFIKSYNEEKDERYFLEVHVQYPEKLHEPYKDVSFSPERINIGKFEKRVANLYDKIDIYIYILSWYNIV